MEVENERVTILIDNVTLIFQMDNSGYLEVVARSTSGQIYDHHNLVITPLHWREAKEVAYAILRQQQKKLLADSKQKRLF
jgi:hypothetical protein